MSKARFDPKDESKDESKDDEEMSFGMDEFSPAPSPPASPRASIAGAAPAAAVENKDFGSFTYDDNWKRFAAEIKKPLAELKKFCAEYKAKSKSPIEIEKSSFLSDLVEVAQILGLYYTFNKKYLSKEKFFYQSLLKTAQLQKGDSIYLSPTIITYDAMKGDLTELNDFVEHPPEAKGDFKHNMKDIVLYGTYSRIKTLLLTLLGSRRSIFKTPLDEIVAIQKSAMDKPHHSSAPEGP